MRSINLLNAGERYGAVIFNVSSSRPTFSNTDMIITLDYSLGIQLTDNV